MNTSSTPKTWFITGASSGLGRAWSRAALARGDRVAGTSREIGRLDGFAAEFGDSFLPLQLDIIDRAACFEAVRRAHEQFGRLDVVVNNAALCHYGVIEEFSEEEARLQLDTNFFGPLWITQAALPFLRAQGGGHIIQVSSVGGHFSTPSLGMYCSSKWALEAMTHAMAAEVAKFGIRVTLIHPGPFATNAEPGSSVPSTQLDVYSAEHEQLRQMRIGTYGPDATNLGDPDTSAAAVLAIADSDDPPFRVFFASFGLALIEGEYEGRLAQWRAAQPYSDMSMARTAGS
jgi:NAD(P)-dependent dehydrogenase (short-subunit alcohol dehydrogenase family)